MNLRPKRPVVEQSWTRVRNACSAAAKNSTGAWTNWNVISKP